MLHIDLKVGDSVMVGDATITLDRKSGQVARLSIEAPEGVSITKKQTNSVASIAAKNGIISNKQ